MGYNQVGISHHKRAEGQSQNRVAREICCLGCHHNGDICEEPKVPHRRGIPAIRKPGLGGGTWPCPCLSDSTSFSRPVRSLPIVIHVICPWAIIFNPISYPPCLKPSQSPFHLTTMWNHFLQCLY